MSKVGKTVPWIKLKGLIAAPSTPFTKNGKSLDLSMIGAYVDKLISDGVKNVYVTGTTGEAYSLSVEERKKVCEEWVKCGKNK
uniref:N-acetylneuraminate lyase n=1 Tax=Saccoglossus kowalevskii TaxID=10224 RepID=A0ABM0MJ68_SACKO|nr:PREDICTED: N-acetylneuraminate lyase-like [Saccoglossus kowalevskii]